jgi:hypothetical protein
VPDTAVDGLSAPDFELRAAAVRGVSHRHHGEPRQDAYAFDAGERWWAVAVADGVGSRPLSHIASHAAVSAAIGSARRVSSGGASLVAWQEVFDAASAAIEHAVNASTCAVGAPANSAAGPWAKAADAPIRRLAAATLVVAVGLRQADGAWRVGSASLGDSRCQLLRQGRWLPLADPPAPDPNALPSSATDALPGEWPGAWRSATVTAGPGDLVVAFTDGIGAPFGTGSGLVASTLAEWWYEPPASLEFAAQVGFLRRGFHDDRAAVGVWLTSAGPGESSEPAERSSDSRD